MKRKSILLVFALTIVVLFTTSGINAHACSNRDTSNTQGVCLAQGKNSTQEGAKIEFDAMEHNFGRVIFKSEPRNAKFTFKNAGNAPLVITRTELSCTCLSVDYPRQPVMPGKSGTVTVTYSPKKDLGPFHNNVKIFSNSTDKRPTTLFVNGDVIKQ